MSDALAPETRRPKQILVGVDDSRPSAWAVATAAQLAEDLSAEITLIHVVPPATGLVTEVPYAIPEVEEELRLSGEGLLQRTRLSVPAGIVCRCLIRTGAAAPQILKAADDIGADFLVLGTRGRGAFAHLLLGSTAEAVVRKAPCPVVTVAHEPKDSTARVAGGVNAELVSAAGTVN